ncbi:hypothetical protein YC2023_015857 [Brassica napus]
MVFYGGEEARLDQGSIPGGEAFTAPSSPVISGRWRLFLLRRRRFYLREGEAYLAPSSPSCPRRVEATVAPHCRFGTRRKFGVGGPDESAVCPMTLSLEDHREGRCFVAGYEIR